MPKYAVIVKRQKGSGGATSTTENVEAESDISAKDTALQKIQGKYPDHRCWVESCRKTSG
jgi:hypothetical protein